MTYETLLYRVSVHGVRDLHMVQGVGTCSSIYYIVLSVHDVGCLYTEFDIYIMHMV